MYNHYSMSILVDKISNRRAILDNKSALNIHDNSSSQPNNL
jgi:hypothetical protein